MMTRTPFPDPDEIDPDDTERDVESYDVPRGTCPRCRSRRVTHLLIGDRSGPLPPGAFPAWVDWVGCAHPGYDRRCTACGNAWDSEPSTSPDREEHDGLSSEQG